jgi:succinate dehydrogenase/fumarate reductase flavoprotein subunit
LGQLYEYTTNPTVATGDGIAIAYNAGAIIQDMEFIQFHPTALALDVDENRFLISEAVRGEGAKLVDTNGTEFMYKYHEKKELAPRDIVTRAIFNEMQEQNLNNVYLNSTHLEKAMLQKRFPNITRICEENGIDTELEFGNYKEAIKNIIAGLNQRKDKPEQWLQWMNLGYNEETVWYVKEYASLVRNRFENFGRTLSRNATRNGI